MRNEGEERCGVRMKDDGQGVRDEGEKVNDKEGEVRETC